MPNIKYDQSQPQEPFISKADSTPATKPRLSLPKISIGGLGKSLLTFLVTFGVVYLSSILAGIISALSSNVTITALSIVFDPQITIAYIATYYFLSHFYDLTRPQTYNLFILTLLLSFTIPFISGAITLMLLPPILKKLHLITKVESQT